MKGIVKEYLAIKNFGWLQAETGEEVFFHAGAWVDEANDCAALQAGDAVEFTLLQSARGLQAADVGKA